MCERSLTCERLDGSPSLESFSWTLALLPLPPLEPRPPLLPADLRLLELWEEVADCSEDVECDKFECSEDCNKIKSILFHELLKELKMKKDS